MSKISVVIPYYQRTPGLLSKAVASVWAQRTEASVHVVIVDDGSPVPARAELKDVPRMEGRSWRLIEQENKGNPRASNCALDHVDDDTDFVAFLDSDDTWTECHLEHARWALEHGYDLYFSDFYQLGQVVTAFDRAKRIRVAEHRRVHPSSPLYEYGGDMVDQIVTGNVLGVSTVVYNFRKFRSLRYSVDFRHTGMEYLLFMNLARGSDKIAFSAEPECRYGAGVNIFSESGWGTSKFLNVLHDEITLQKHLSSEFDLTASQTAVVRGRLWDRRSSYGKGVLHNMLHNPGGGLRGVWSHLKADPMTALAIVGAPWTVISGRVRAHARRSS